MGKRAKKNAANAGTAGHDVGGKPESIARKLYSAVGAMVAGMIARKLIEKAWARTTGKKPPTEPESPTVHWAEAVGWSVASGTAVGVARLLATRKAAGAWARVSADSADSADGAVAPERAD